jgi:DNA polymerase-1
MNPDPQMATSTLRPTLRRRVKTIRTREQLDELVGDYRRFPEFVIDVETHATRPSRALPGQPKTKDKPALDERTNEVWCVSLAGFGRCDVIPLDHPDKPYPLLPRPLVFAALEPLLFSERRKVGHNVKFDLLSIAKYYDDDIPPPPYGDTLVGTFLLDENLGKGNYGLGALSERFLGYRYADKLGERAWEVDFDQAVEYSLIDARCTWMLWRHLWYGRRGFLAAPMQGRFQRRGMEKLRAISELEMQVLEVLLDTKQYGAFLDVGGLEAMVPVLEARLQAARDKVRTLAGRDFPDTFFNSHLQKGDYFYGELGLPVEVLTPKGKPSTSEAALKKLAKKSKVAATLVEHANIDKLLGTFVKGLLPHVESDSRIRTNFNQAQVVTGRLSSSEPNLQQLPIRDKAAIDPKSVRRVFGAPPGYLLVVADFNQIELRVLAHYSQDRLLVKAYREGIDLHKQTASALYSVPISEVTAAQRSIGKTVNFAIAYGSGAARIADQVGISNRQAGRFLNVWHDTYPGVGRWGGKIETLCWTEGYVETLFGRRRRLRDIRSADIGKRREARRQAVNAAVQGTAADLAKRAMVQIYQSLLGRDAHLILMVHDEFLVETAEDEAGEVAKLVEGSMENIDGLDGRPALSVPLVADVSIAANWADAK